MMTPKGGVIAPIAQHITITSPKCTMSIPRALTTGAKMGAMTIIAAVPSMNIPMIRNSATTISRNKYLLLTVAARKLPMD